MSDVASSPRSGFLAFGRAWIVLTLITWGVCCLLALIFLYRDLEAGMVPGEIMLALALVPVSITTLIVQAVLGVLARRKWPDSEKARNRAVYFGTPILSLVILLLLLALAGGPDSFIIRI